MSEGCWICEYDPGCDLCPVADEVLIEPDLADEDADG